jgi:hypothetical protein
MFEDRVLRRILEPKRHEAAGSWVRLLDEELYNLFLFITASRPALGPTEPPIQGVPWALSLGVKRPRREAGHSPPPSAEVKNVWSYASIPNTPSWRGAQLNHRDIFTFTFTLYKILLR